MARLGDYLGLVRFSHTIFALPFAFLSASLAWTIEPFRWQDALGILLCMVFARNFAMAFNRLVDRRIDAKNPRTAGRHLPAKTLSVAGVTLFAIVNALLFVAATLLFTLREPPNHWPLLLAVPVLVIVAMYSLTKRFTALAHVWLGAALALAPIAAWIAIVGLEQLTVPLILGAAVLFWVAGFDILYACQDADFDRQEGLHSIPGRLGVKRSLRVAALSHAVMFALLIALHFAMPLLGIVYLAGLAVIGVLLVYQHWLVKPDDLARVNRAFFHVNAVISMGLLAIVLLQLALAF